MDDVRNLNKSMISRKSNCHFLLFCFEKKGGVFPFIERNFFEMIDALVLGLLLLLSLHAIDEQKEERTDPCHAVIAQYDHAIALSPHVV